MSLAAQRRLRILLATALVTGLLAGCGTTSPSAPPSTGQPTPLTVGLGYIPDVQFAQFYLADRAGYYRAAGLDVTFENKTDPDLVTLVGQGTVDIGIADGTSLIPAVSQGIPVRYVATVYADFPNVVFAKTSAGIGGPGDLKGKRLGIPGKYGSSWIMLQALLASVGLSPADLEIVAFPDYGQGIAVREDIVDAATGFVNNEPLRLERSGQAVVVLRVDAVTPLPGPGLITGARTLAGPKRDALRAFVAATLRAMREIAADPEQGLDAAIAVVPQIGDDREGQLAVLRATVDAWQSGYTGEHGWGAIDEGAWTRSIDFMSGLPDSPVAKPVTVDQLVTQELLP